MYRALTALALASVSVSANSSAPETLNSAAPWWEKISVLVAGDGQTQSCRYESSLRPNAGQDCSVVDAKGVATSAGGGSGGARDQLTRITFERRFVPGEAKPEMAALQPGETLLGGRVLSMAIDAKGAVKNCQIVASSGEVTPQYGCDELAAERFEASAGAHPSAAAREGYMAIIVYGHSEHVV